MAEFGAAAELSLELAPGEAAGVRKEIEDELGGVGVGGGAAGSLGGGGGSALTDGGIETAVEQLGEQTDILEDILDVLETGGVSGGGGGIGGIGGGGGLIPSIGAGAAGGAAGGAGIGTLLGVLGAGAGVVGGTGLALEGINNVFEGVNPGGITSRDILGQVGIGATATGTGRGDADGTSFRPENALGILAERAGGGIASFLSGNPRVTSDQLPGNITRETIRQNRNGGRSVGPSRQNRAAETRQSLNPVFNLDVTVEQTREALDQLFMDAKREAAREVAQEVNRDIAGTSSLTGL